MDSATTIHAAKLVSVTSSFLVAGYCLGFSQNGVAELYEERPQISTPIFVRIFNRGAYCAVPLSISSLLSSVYLTYSIPEQRPLWAASAACILAIRFATEFLMMPGINKLIKISEEKKLQEKSEQTLEHRQLLVSWVNQNYLRTAAALASGLLGLWACTA